MHAFMCVCVWCMWEVRGELDASSFLLPCGFLGLNSDYVWQQKVTLRNE